MGILGEEGGHRVERGMRGLLGAGYKNASTRDNSIMSGWTFTTCTLFCMPVTLQLKKFYNR